MAPKPNKPDGDSPHPAITPPPRPLTPRPEAARAVPGLAEIVASAPAFIFLLDLEGRYLYTSRRARGGAFDEEEGKLLEQVHAPQQVAEFRELMKRVLKSGRTQSIELASVDTVGRPRQGIVTLAPFLVRGRIDGFVGVGMTAASDDIVPTDPSAVELASRLTPKQREVLVLVAEGHSSREIGRRLGVGERTVETHREQLMDRLQIRGVAALARFAMSAGLL